jgi:hypothetical protein
MFDFVTDLITPIGPVGSEIAPISSLLKAALDPPIIYFIGLVLLGGVVAVVSSLKR